MKKILITIIGLSTLYVNSATVINRLPFTDLLERCVNNNIDDYGNSNNELSNICFDNISGWPTDGFDNTAAGFKQITLASNNCSEMIYPTPSDSTVKRFNNNFYYKLPAKKNGTKLINISNFNTKYGIEISEFSCSGGSWSKTSIQSTFINQKNYCDPISINTGINDYIVNFKKTAKNEIATTSFDNEGYLHNLSLRCINPAKINVNEQWDIPSLLISSVQRCNINDLLDIKWSESVDKSYNGDFVGNRTFQCQAGTVTGNYPNFMIIYDSFNGAAGSLGFFKNQAEAILFNNRVLGEATVSCINGQWIITDKNCENTNNIMQTTNIKSTQMFNSDGELIEINKTIEFITTL